MPVAHQVANSLPLASSLPRISFRRVSESEARLLSAPAGVQDQHLISFGFNDGAEFERPEHYLRHVEPIESELNKQVEYDMDEQDQEWLDSLNTDRRREQMDTVSYEVFEIIIDRLEKEWFDLMQLVPQKPMMPSVGPDGEPIDDPNEDIACAICDDGECENSNAIVFCDGCNLAVHQDCYGIPYIPEGQWLCRKCTVSPDRAVTCVLCPHEGGAFKQTTQGKWAHLLCAMWIPETGVSNPVYMEPIDSVERIPKARWRLQCYICRKRVGACIQCDNKHCFTSFHVTCGRRAGLLLKSQRQRVAHTPDSEEDVSGEKLRAWCHKHLPKSIRAQRTKEEEFQDAYSQPPSPELEEIDGRRNGLSMPATPAHKKSARAYKKSFRANLSLVPVYVLNRVVDYMSRLHVRKKQQLVIQVAKFWSLKREARRGAPLLKRLHLEPWTTNTAGKEQGELGRLKTLRFLLQMREDLEKVRMLAELVRKREKEKQRQAQLIRSVVLEQLLHPYNALMRGVLDRVAALDRSSLFLYPVSLQVVPDYLDVIKKPMCWSAISAKLDDLSYTNVQEFKNDVLLVLDNAMLYNKVDTAYHRTAARILHVAGTIFAELDVALDVHGEDVVLGLEPEQSIVDLLIDGAKLEEDNQSQAMSSPAEDVENVVLDLTRHYALPLGIKALEKAEEGNIGGQSKKAAKKAAQAERNRLAALKREETRQLRLAEQQDQTIESQHASDEVIVKARRSTRGHARHASNEAEEPAQLQVSAVDDIDSFKRFNVGWVLPDGSKRNRIRPLPDAIGQSEAHSQASLPRSQSHASALNKAKSVPTRELSRRRRLSEIEDTSTTIETPVKRMKTLIDSQIMGRQSASSEKLGRRTSLRSGGGKMATMKQSAPVTFKPGMLCWAKLEGHPFFPAEVQSQAHDQIPKHVLRSRPKGVGGEQNTEAMHLIRFFDDVRSYGWAMDSKIRTMMEDTDLDDRLLKAAKAPKVRRDILAAFERAKSQIP